MTELPCFTAHGVHFDIYSEGSKGSFSRPRSGSKTEKLFSILRTYNGKEPRPMPQWQLIRQSITQSKLVSAKLTSRRTNLAIQNSTKGPDEVEHDVKSET